ncbi:MAG TPA: histidine kinase [Terriglobales bacterium]|nr:histidine kinase [Terriglobales bacterium]
MCTPAAHNLTSIENAIRVFPEELKVLMQQRTDAVRSLSARLLRVQDEERRHLARELHDSTGQTLTALKLQLASMQQRSRSGPIGPEYFSQVNDLADQALRDIRTTSYLLFPPLLDEAGFCSAAKWYVEGFSNRSNVRVRLDLASIGRLPCLIETAFFRVLQESLANIYRHSASSVADVRTRRDSGEVILEVQDYGSGIPSHLLEQFKRAGTGSGVGLGGMRERMEDFGGRLEIVSSASGTLVRAGVLLESGSGA